MGWKEMAAEVRMQRRAPLPTPIARDARLVDVAARCIRCTNRAVLIRHHGRDEWFPKAVIHRSSKVRVPGDHGRFVVLASWNPAPPKLCNDPS